jgi:hypothetical protein
VHPFFRFAWLPLLIAACDSGESYKVNRFGSVLLQSDSTPEATRAASAFFYRYDSSQDVGDCYVAGQTTQCNIWSCSDALYTNPGTFPPLSVGDLSVTGTTEDLIFTEGEVGDYSAEIPFDGPLWAEGSLLIAHASGSADFPKTEAALNAPLPLTVTGPAPVDGMLVIDPTVDLRVNWSAPRQGAVYSAISTETTTVEGKSVILPGIDCIFDASLGQGTIPKEVIAHVPRPETLTGYRFDVLTFTTGRGISDDAALTVRATTFGLTTSASITE